MQPGRGDRLWAPLVDDARTMARHIVAGPVAGPAPTVPITAPAGADDPGGKARRGRALAGTDVIDKGLAMTG
ncbi:hypothetical protein [Streptomyces sp. NPDC046759]|uniref:hypothetical protein n=1 Tax=Streptomyces sp. NPDC046759 TaxID=3155019 RepID=UPI0033DC7453